MPVRADLADATEPAQPIPWPHGHRAAAALTFDVDAESAVLSVRPTSARRLSVMSHQAYGPLTGVPRILRLLETYALRATFFVPGFTAERYPSTVERIAAAGHEVAHHSFLHESVQKMGPGAEAAMIDRGLEALDRVAGITPLGYRAPLWELSYRTIGLLADRGFLYDSSMMDCDLPYELSEGPKPGARSVVEVPVHWSLDDWEQYAFVPEITGSGLIESPAKVLEMWTAELEAFHAHGLCFVLTNHPFLSGRPSRVAALEQLLERMTALGGMWVATVGEIAAHVRSLGLRPRVFPQPVVTGHPAEARRRGVHGSEED